MSDRIIVITPEVLQQLMPSEETGADTKAKMDQMDKDRGLLEQSLFDQAESIFKEMKRAFNDEYAEVIAALKTKFEVNVDFEYDEYYWESCENDGFSLTAYIRVGSDYSEPITVEYTVDKEILEQMPAYEVTQEIKKNMAKLEDDLEKLSAEYHSGQKKPSLSSEEMVEKLRELLKGE